MISCFEDYSLLGINRSVLSSFSSYLTDQSQRICVTDVLWDEFALPWGVPQGSCLGRLLFIIYTSKLFEIFDAHLPNVHAYADETLFYLSFRRDDLANRCCHGALY